MLKELDTYDWREAFGYAGEPDTCALGEVNVATIVNTGVDPRPFTREDVAHIEAMSEGYNDGPDWVIVGRLHDGRWFCLYAGCDYTGWDCRAKGNASVANSLNAIIRLGLSDSERARLGLALPAADDPVHFG